MSESGCVRCGAAASGRRCEACGLALLAGPYRIEALLREAGQSRTYRALAPDGTRVLLKELLFVLVPNAASLEAFSREAELLKQLAHPAIPAFLAHFAEGEGPQLRLYLAERFVDGPDLLAELEQRRWSEAEGVELVRQLLAVLDYLHARTPPLFHRDIKPANVIRSPDGAFALVDFGSARDAVLGTAAGATQAGTIGYAPPEQFAGVVTSSSDIFALAATALHLLSRVAPWERMASGQTKVGAEVGLSPGFRAWLDRALAPEPAKRFQTAAAAREALGALSKPARALGSRGRSILLGLGAVVALGALGGLGFVLFPKKPPVTLPLLSEPCPADTVIGGESDREKFCAIRIGEKTVREGPAAKYQPFGERPYLTEVAHYRNDVLHGRFERYLGNDLRVVEGGEYVDGRRQGIWRMHDGTGPMVDGERDGVWTRDSRGGSGTETWVAGKKSGPFLDRAHGGEKRSREGTYLDGMLDGELREYSADGETISAKLGYRRNGLEGHAVRYHAGGKQILEEGDYERSQKVGDWKRYRANGELEEVSTWLAGRRTEIERFHPGGQKALSGRELTSHSPSLTSWRADGSIAFQVGPCPEQLRVGRDASCRSNFRPDGVVERIGHISGYAPAEDGTKESGPRFEGAAIEYGPKGEVVATGPLAGGHLGGPERRGVWTTFDALGRPIRTDTWSSGRRNGPATELRANGDVKASGEYRNDERVGQWLEFAPGGRILRSTDYKAR